MSETEKTARRLALELSRRYPSRPIQLYRWLDGFYGHSFEEVPRDEVEGCYALTHVASYRNGADLL